MCMHIYVHVYMSACIVHGVGVRGRVLPEKGTLMRGVKLHGHCNFRKRSTLAGAAALDDFCIL